MDAVEWEAAGLYDPEAPGAADRLALLEYLAARGATLEQMIEAHRLDYLPGLAGELVGWGQPAMISVEELAARCEAPVETVRRALLAAGFPVGEDTEVPETLDATVSAFLQGEALMGEEPILAFTRVLGAAATNVAEAAVALFYAELGPGSGREGHDELARAHVAERATMAFTVVPEAFRRVLLAQFERATRRAAIVRGPWGFDPNSPLLTSETVSLGFVDLVGSTSWAETLSSRDHTLALSRFESAAWSSSVLGGGRVVKMIGDEAFFAAPTVDAACTIATQVCRAAAEDAALPEARAAVGHGLVTSREGDYFGPVVNVVSRLVKVAPPGSVLVTEDAAAELADGRWHLRPLGPQTLRGIEQRVDAFEVTPGAPSTGPG